MIRVRLTGLILVALLNSGCSDETQTGAAQAVSITRQIEQLRAAAADPASISDKLFVSWEYAGALREVALAQVVLAKSQDPEVRALAVLVRDGHQAGMAAMMPIAGELNLALPIEPTSIEAAAIAAASALPPAELDRFFLRRQRAMHAWDITVFNDYAGAARNPHLRHYIGETRSPLREHAVLVVKLANRRGISGGLAIIEGQKLQPSRR